MTQSKTKTSHSYFNIATLIIWKITHAIVGGAVKRHGYGS